LVLLKNIQFELITDICNNLICYDIFTILNSYTKILLNQTIK